jgi:hypothetical protein
MEEFFTNLSKMFCQRKGFDKIFGTKALKSRFFEQNGMSVHPGKPVTVQTEKAWDGLVVLSQVKVVGGMVLVEESGGAALMT